jgi:short-subunit dehydrogenase
VITVKPGFVRTAMTDKNEFYMPFLMEVEKAAKIIRKGIEKGRSVVQFPFPTVMLSRFVKFLPNWIYDPSIRASRGIKKKKKS